MSDLHPRGAPAGAEGSPEAPRWALWAATALGAGRSPVAPGTAGSLAGLLLYLPAFWAGDLWWAVAAGELAAVLALSALAVPPVLRASGIRDPQFVVIDEVAGMLVALAFFPPNPVGAGAAFLLFRLFDVAKPFPVGRLERLPGAWGVMADDLAAGLFAGASVLLGMRFLT